MLHKISNQVFDVISTQTMKFLFWNLIIWMSNLHRYEGKLKALFLLLPMLLTAMLAPWWKQNPQTFKRWLGVCSMLWVTTTSHPCMGWQLLNTIFDLVHKKRDYLKHMVSGGCIGRKAPSGGCIGRKAPISWLPSHQTNTTGFFPMGLCE